MVDRGVLATVLVVIDEISIVDHAVALARQFDRIGVEWSFVTLPAEELPSWAEPLLPERRKVPVESALENLGRYRAVWVSRPYLRAFPDSWQGFEKVAPLVYSGYGLPMTEWDDTGYDSDFYQHCAFLMARSDREFRNYAQSALGETVVCLAGDPLLHEINKQAPAKHSDTVRKVLWAPHWSKSINGKRGFFNWRWTHGALRRFFQSNPDISLIIRNHPYLKLRDPQSVEGRKVRRLVSLKNVEFSSQSLMDDVLEADVMIADGISILGYFGISGKRMAITIDKIHTPPFNMAGWAVAKSVPHLKSKRDVLHWLNSVTSGGPQSAGSSGATRAAITREFLVSPVSPGEKLAACW